MWGLPWLLIFMEKKAIVLNVGPGAVIDGVGVLPCPQRDWSVSGSDE